MFSPSLLRFCLLALVLAQRSERGSNSQASGEITSTGRGSGSDDDGSTTVDTSQAAGRNSGRGEDGAEEGPNTMAAGPIGAGIGFCVCFLAVVVYLCRKDYQERKEDEAHEVEEKQKHEAELKPSGEMQHVVGLQWRALRGDARMRAEADLTSAVVLAEISEGEVLEQIDGPVMVGSHERIKIRTTGAEPKEGWITPDARPNGPVFFEACISDVWV